MTLLAVKTGFLYEAGYCLVVEETGDKKGIVAVVLNSPSEEQHFIDISRLISCPSSRNALRSLRGFAYDILPDMYLGVIVISWTSNQTSIRSCIGRWPLELWQACCYFWLICCRNTLPLSGCQCFLAGLIWGGYRNYQIQKKELANNKRTAGSA